MEPAVVSPPKPLKMYDHRRFLLPDVEKKGQWLVDRIKAHYKNSTEAELVSWIRNVTTSDQFLFVHTEHSVALAQIMREALSAKPRVKELFVVCLREKDIEEGAYLYSVLHQWACNMGASEFIVETFTDVPREKIKERVGGGMFKRDMVYVRIG